MLLRCNGEKGETILLKKLSAAAPSFLTTDGKGIVTFAVVHHFSKGEVGFQAMPVLRIDIVQIEAIGLCGHLGRTAAGQYTK